MLLIFCLIPLSLWGQDERYYRQMLTGDLPKMGSFDHGRDVEKMTLNGSNYFIDLNDDGIEEMIQPKKREGVDWIEIKDSSSRVIFSSKLLAMGGGSHIYKIKLAYLSKKIKLLVFYLDEGKTHGKRFESTGRIFLLPIENSDLSKLTMTPGPHHFHEKEAQREQYFRRDYAVEIRDVNADGLRDVIVSFNHIQRIMLYRGQGEWTKL